MCCCGTGLAKITKIIRFSSTVLLPPNNNKGTHNSIIIVPYMKIEDAFSYLGPHVLQYDDLIFQQDVYPSRWSFATSWKLISPVPMHFGHVPASDWPAGCYLTSLWLESLGGWVGPPKYWPRCSNYILIWLNPAVVIYSQNHRYSTHTVDKTKWHHVYNITVFSHFGFCSSCLL